MYVLKSYYLSFKIYLSKTEKPSVQKKSVILLPKNSAAFFTETKKLYINIIIIYGVGCYLFAIVIRNQIVSV